MAALLPARGLSTTVNVGSYAALTNAIAVRSDGDTINLTSNITTTAEIVIAAKGLTIDGNTCSISVLVPGLDASGVVNASPSDFRVFNIGASGRTNTIRNVTILGGAPDTSGGAILNTSGTLVLDHVTVTQSGGADASGGGVANSGGTVFLRDCNVSRNAAHHGGGFLNGGAGAKMFMERCTFSDNRSMDSNGGGGAGENQQALYANNSTFDNNKSTELGGAVNNYSAAASAYFVGCTFAGNMAYNTNYPGGAIANNGGTLTLVNSLFAYNYRNKDGSYTLDDINNYSGAAPTAYYCVFHSTMTNQLANGGVATTRYMGDPAGFGDYLFCGGATAQVLGSDGSPVGTWGLYQPFLVKAGTSLTPTAALQPGSFAFGKGTRAAFSSTPATPVVGYYNGSSWVTLAGSGASGYEVTTDQNGTGRASSNTVGAVVTTATNLCMLKVNAGTNGTVSGGTVYGDVYPYGTTVTLTGIPAAGYSLLKWKSTRGSDVSTTNPCSITLTTSVTLISVFAVHMGSTITYAGNGSTSGTAPEQQMLGVGGSGTIAGQGTMARNGYAFTTWNTRVDGNGTTYNPGTVFSGPGNLNLYAKWIPMISVDHFAWSSMSSPQHMGEPFTVSISARDYLSSVVTSFTGKASLLGVRTEATNSILGNLTPTSSIDGTWTVGYEFTPNVDLTVTHVRHYSGTKVSIWKATGELLASRTVTSTPGTWVETALVTPLQLQANNHYRVGVYVHGSGTTYWCRRDGGTTFPDGVINQSYYKSSDAFPDASNDAARWPFVDLRYRVAAGTVVSISPTNTGSFVSGAWSGQVSVQQIASNMLLIASDGNGHAGTSGVFTVAVAQPQPPSVANVLAAQRPGSRLVDVTYDLDDPDTATLAVTAAVSTNGGATYFTPASALSGDLGSVTAGTGRTITWNAGALSTTGFFNNVRVQVTASDGIAATNAVSPAFAMDMQFAVTIQARVRDRTSHAWLQGVTVAVGSMCATTDVNGFFTLSNVPLANGNLLSATKATYATQLQEVAPPPGTKTLVLPYIEMIAMATYGTPMVTKLDAKYDGIFISCLPIQNRYTATVNWNGAPTGSVQFTAKTIGTNVMVEVDGAGPSYSCDVDMPTAFQPSLQAYANALQVVAVSTSGARSSPLQDDVFMVSVPAALEVDLKLITIGVTADASDVTGTLKLNIPPDPIEATLDLPVVGKFGFETAFNAGLEYALRAGAWKAYLGAGTEGSQKNLKRKKRPTGMKLYLGQNEIDGAVSAGANGILAKGKKFSVDEIFGHLEISGKFEAGRVGIPDLLTPGASTTLAKIPGVNKALNFVTIIFYVEPGITGDLVFSLNDDSLKFKSFVVTGKVGLEAAWEPKLGPLELRLYVGGEPSVTFGIPKPYFKQVRFQAYAGVEAKVWIFKYEGKYVFVNVAYPKNYASSARLALPLGEDANGGYVILTTDTTSGWQMMDRKHLLAGPEVFVAGGSSVKSMMVSAATPGTDALNAFRLMCDAPVLGAVGSAKQAPAGGVLPLGMLQANAPLQADLPLVSNVYPEGEPALAANTNKLMLLYVADNGASNTLQCTDIRWTYWDGTNWSAPATILADTRAEFAPQVAFASNGVAVALWERVAATNFTSATGDFGACVDAMAAQMEIVSSTWNPGTGVWTAPQAITTNSVLDHMPLLCEDKGGSVLAVWTRNAANLMAGTNGAPDSVLTATWQPAPISKWTAPQTLLASVANRGSQSLACSKAASGYAIYAWTADVDGTATDAATREVFVCERSGGVWGAPVQLTTNDVPDMALKVTVGLDDVPVLVWRQGDDLVMRRGLAGETRTVRAASGTTGFADFALTRGPLGNIVLVWQEMTAAGSDAHYMVYDPVSDTWGQDALLCNDPSLERSFAPVFDSAGYLTVAYNKVGMTNATVHVQAEDGSMVDVGHVPQPGRVDLYVSKRALVQDLAILPGDFVVEGENFLPGDAVSLSAVVRNVGDVAVSNTVVGFYDGNPDAGGVLISNTVLTGWFQAASSNVVQALWVVPEPATNHTLFAVVNRAGAGTENTQTNNTQSVAVGGTDLSVSLASYNTDTNGALRIYALVKNLCAPAAGATSLALRRCDALGTPQAGSPLATVAVPTLAPGRLTQVAFDLPLGTQPRGDAYYQLSLDEAHAVADTDASNNVVVFSATLWVDTDGDGMPDIYETAHGLNPLVADAANDPDHDGLTNLQEYQLGTDPHLADTDGDGMNDGDEIAAATDPLSSDSLLRVTMLGAKAALNTQNYVPLVFQSVNGITYNVEVATNVAGTWQKLGETFVAVSNRTQVLLPVPDDVLQAFYRVRRVVPQEPLTYTLGYNLPDQWIDLYAWDALPADTCDLRNAGDDPDGDGLNNLNEMLAGTDPTDASSNLRVLSAKTSYILPAAQAAAEKSYSVETQMPGETAWQPVALPAE